MKPVAVLLLSLAALSSGSRFGQNHKVPSAEDQRLLNSFLDAVDSNSPWNMKCFVKIIDLIKFSPEYYVKQIYCYLIRNLKNYNEEELLILMPYFLENIFLFPNFTDFQYQFAIATLKKVEWFVEYCRKYYLNVEILRQAFWKELPLDFFQTSMNEVLDSLEGVNFVGRFFPYMTKEQKDFIHSKISTHDVTRGKHLLLSNSPDGANFLESLSPQTLTKILASLTEKELETGLQKILEYMIFMNEEQQIITAKFVLIQMFSQKYININLLGNHEINPFDFVPVRVFFDFFSSVSEIVDQQAFFRRVTSIYRIMAKREAKIAIHQGLIWANKVSIFDKEIWNAFTPDFSISLADFLSEFLKIPTNVFSLFRILNGATQEQKETLYRFATSNRIVLQAVIEFGIKLNSDIWTEINPSHFVNAVETILNTGEIRKIREIADFWENNINFLKGNQEIKESFEPLRKILWTHCFASEIRNVELDPNMLRLYNFIIFQ